MTRNALLLIGLAGAIGCASGSAGPAAATADVAASAAPTAEGYVVELGRARPAGTRYRTEEESHTKTVTTVKVQGQVAKEETEEKHVLFAADVEVLELNVSVRYAIDTLTLDGQPVLPAGSVVVLTRGEPGSMKLEGGELTEPAKKALDAVLTTRPYTDDDNVFGTGQRQNVGDTWGIDKAAAVKDLSSLAQLTSDQLDGQVSFLSLDTVEGVETMKLGLKMRIEGIGSEQLPPGATLEKSKMLAEMEQVLPTDPNDVTFLGEDNRVDMEMVIVLPEQQGMRPRVTMTTQERETTKIRPLQ